MNDLKIKRIIIDGFKNKRRQVSLNFSESNTTVLYGMNGVGKTTFLNSLYSIFSKDENKLAKEKIKNIYIEYSEDNTFKSVNIRNLYGDKYYWEDFDKSNLSNCKVLYITPNRAFKDYRKELTMEDLHMYFEDKVDAKIGLDSSYDEIKKFIDYINGISIDLIKEWINSNDNIFVNGITTVNIETLILEYDRYLKEKVDFEKLKIEKNILILTLRILEDFNSSNINNKLEDYVYFTEYERKLIKELDPSILNILNIVTNSNANLTNKSKKDILQIKKLLTTFNKNQENKNKGIIFFEKMTNKKIIINSNEVLIYYDGIFHDLKGLSNGEGHLLTILILVELLGKKRDLILIDEPEIALDTRWQKILMPILEEITDSQILLTCHSPYISINNFECQKKLFGGLKID